MNKKTLLTSKTISLLDDKITSNNPVTTQTIKIPRRRRKAPESPQHSGASSHTTKKSPRSYRSKIPQGPKKKKSRHVSHPIQTEKKEARQGKEAKKRTIQLAPRFESENSIKSRTIQGTCTKPSMGSQVNPRLCSMFRIIYLFSSIFQERGGDGEKKHGPRGPWH